MKTRQIVIIGVALVILVGAKLLSDKLGEPKEKQSPLAKSGVTTVFAETVTNSDVPVVIESTGLLEAVNRMELYSEVQGVMLPDNGRFKAGNTFSSGQTLINIRANDQRASVIAKRSAFQRVLSSVLPDIKLDFVDEFAAWQNYLQNMDVESSLSELPEVNSEKLKLFLTGRNVFAEYYAVKNAEILLSKYSIQAPYTGVLVEADADPGTVIRPGQRLGVFIKPGVYELEVSVSASVAEFLKKGQEVILTLEGKADKTWKGKITRVNRAINPESQLSQIFVGVNSSELRDGMYLKAEVKGEKISSAFEIPRSVLMNGNEVYLVQSGILVVQTIIPVHFNERTVIVKGLEDGMQVITKMPPAAFEGMKVTVYKEN